MPSPVSKSDQKELKELGARIRAIRKQKGLSLQDVAYAIDKDKQSISRIENGNVNPSYIYLLQICKGMDVDIKEIM